MRKRRCRGCDTYFRPEEGTPPWVKWCGDECQEIIALRILAKTQADREKQAEKKRLKEKKENRKARLQLNENDRGHQEKLTQSAFNKLVRLLDEGERCISCNREKCGHTWDCGHFISVGSMPALRFCFLNAWRQGSACNRGEEKFRANAGIVRDGYEENLINRIGRDAVDWLKGPHKPNHYTIEDFKRMRKEFNAEIRYIEKHGKPSREWRSLKLEEEAA